MKTIEVESCVPSKQCTPELDCLMQFSVQVSVYSEFTAVAGKNSSSKCTCKLFLDKVIIIYLRTWNTGGYGLASVKNNSHRLLKDGFNVKYMSAMLSVSVRNVERRIY